MEDRVLLSAFTVTKLTDDGSSGTLRWAVGQADAAAGIETINFQAGLTGTIILKSGVLELSAGDITINGPGASTLTVSGNKASQVFLIDGGVTGIISGLTISGGFSNSGTGTNFGGAIDNQGILTVNTCTISGNTVTGKGGGLYNGDKLYVNNSTVSGNSTTIGSGGGIYNYDYAKITNCTISGNSAGSSTGGGGGVYNQSGVLIVTGCTITNNSETNATGSGGGILNRAGKVTVSNSTVSGNKSNDRGAGFGNNGDLYLTNDNISSDAATIQGGGINNFGSMTVTNCTFSGDTATTGGGGGVFNYNGSGGATDIVLSCTFSSDSADKNGGGIRNYGGLSVTNSTFSGDLSTAGDGGGLYTTVGALTVTNCTFSNNKADLSGGGIFILNTGGDEATLYNTIVIGNTNASTASDISGPLDGGLAVGQTASSNNLIGIGGAGGLTNGVRGNQVGVAVATAKLSALSSNGGPTQTIALLSGSPAIDAGSNALALDSTGHALKTDQRGGAYNRIVHGIVDIGAFEAQAQLVFTVEPATETAGKAISPAVVVEIETVNNQVLTTDNSNITITKDAGPGTLTGTVTVAAKDGVATFSNLIFTDAAAGYTLEAADSADTAGVVTAGVSSAFTVVAAAVAHLVFVQNPTSVVAGANITPGITVKATDAYGNLCGGVSVKLAIGSGPTGGALFGTVTAVTSATGVATFSTVSLHLAGAYTLTASVGAVVTPKSTAFNVTAAAIHNLAFVQNPTNVIAGVNDAPAITVKATDAYGNIIAGAAVKLAIGSGPVGGALFGTITGTTSATGIATFSTVSLHLAGAYTLTASDGAIVSPKSTAFNVTHAALVHLAFVQNPTNVVAGVNIAPSITVKATDTYGNIISGASVKLAIGSGPVGGALFGTVTATTSATGIATFSTVSLHLAGSYTLTASFGAIVSPKSTAFTVSAAKASKLVFTTLPVGAKHGVAFSVKVSVEDAFGNVLIADNTGTITLALATHPTGSTLAGTLIENVVKGVATFSTLSVSAAGSYSLKATDSFALAAITSTAFAVS